MKERLTEDFYDDGSGSIRHCEISDNIEINCGVEDYQDIIDKLAEYEMAEQEGRLKILPCKVGDTVYNVVPKGNGLAYREDIVSKISINDNGIFIHFKNGLSKNISSFNKSLFLII